MQLQVKAMSRADFARMSDDELLGAYRTLAAQELRRRGIDAARVGRERTPYPESERTSR